MNVDDALIRLGESTSEAVAGIMQMFAGDAAQPGPVAIVPAPYSRNWDRLTRALTTEHAGLRSDRGLPGSSERGDAVAVVYNDAYQTPTLDAGSPQPRAQADNRSAGLFGRRSKSQ